LFFCKWSAFFFWPLQRFFSLCVCFSAICIYYG
jgi:hypothetical protein